MSKTAARAAAWLAGVWAGGLACIGGAAAPAAFATLTAADAGRFVARLFAQEAYASLALAVVIFLLLRVRGRSASGSVLGLDLLLVLGTIFCTVGGYFAVQPMMAAARAGLGPWSFGALHAVSGASFVLKGLLVAVLAWRLLPGRRPFSLAATS